MEDVQRAMKAEKNAVVRERLLVVSMFLDKIPKGKIAMLIHRDRSFVGHWISAYFKGGCLALAEARGKDHKSYLTPRQKEDLKYIIENTYPIIFKGWDGKIIVELIQSKYNVTYTREGVYALLKSLNITHKLAKKSDPKKSEVKINAWKEESKKTT